MKKILGRVPETLWDKWVEFFVEKGYEEERAENIVAFIMSDPRILSKHFGRIDDAEELRKDILEVLDEMEMDQQTRDELLRLMEEELKKEVQATPATHIPSPTSIDFSSILTTKQVPTLCRGGRVHIDEYDEENDKKRRAINLYNNGTIHQERGEYEKALKYFEEALQIFEEIRDKEGIATALNNIGMVYKDRGENNKALEYFKESLKLFEEIGDKVQAKNIMKKIEELSHR